MRILKSTLLVTTWSIINLGLQLLNGMQLQPSFDPILVNISIAISANFNNPEGFIRTISKLRELCIDRKTFIGKLRTCLLRDEISLCSIKDLSGGYPSILYAACDLNDCYALRIICEVADEDLWELLSAQNEKGLTALHQAALFGNEKIAVMLLKAAEMCDKTLEFIAIQDCAGYTAIKYADATITQLLQPNMPPKADSKSKDKKGGKKWGKRITSFGKKGSYFS